MKLKWLWRICPCRRCHGFRINRAYVEVLLRDMRETTGVVVEMGYEFKVTEMPDMLGLAKVNMASATEIYRKCKDEFVERKSYAYGVYEDPYGGTGP